MTSRLTKKPRRWRLVLVVAVLLVATFAIFGCTSVVTAPPDPVDATRVFILREALHVGLVLPEGETPHRHYVEFGYGDWGYYALGHNAWYQTFSTVLWPTAGTLSRREFAADRPATLRAAASWAELDELRVGRSGVDRLRDRLETTTFAAGAAQEVHQPRFRMDFVPAERNYWFLDTCADAVADWLTELGCSVSWVPIRGSLETAK